MLSYNTPITVEKHPHRFLGTPDCLVLIKHFYALFLSLYLEDQELSCTISYFSSFCHIYSLRLQLSPCQEFILKIAYICVCELPRMSIFANFLAKIQLISERKEIFHRNVISTRLAGICAVSNGTICRQQNLKISNLKTKIHFGFKISSKLINIIIYYNILLY